MAGKPVSRGLTYIANAAYDRFAKTLDPSAWAVYCGICRHAPEEGIPSSATVSMLARETGITGSDVEIDVRSLAMLKLIAINRDGSFSILSVAE